MADESKITKFLVKIRNISLIYVAGAMTGGTLYHNVNTQNLDHFKSLAIQGLCGGLDIESTYYWKPCGEQAPNIDAIIAAKVQQEDYDYDRASLDKLVKKGGRK